MADCNCKRKLLMLNEEEEEEMGQFSSTNKRRNMGKALMAGDQEDNHQPHSCDKRSSESSDGDKVRFNLRGTKVETTMTTLALAPRCSMLGALSSSEWNPQPQREEHFFDRGSECFSILLDLLSTGDLHVPPHIHEKQLYNEALFYGLEDRIRFAKVGRFDGNLLRLKNSVTNQTLGKWTAVRASPTGGFAVNHDKLVRIYDWLLEEHTPLSIDYQSVYDMGWVDDTSLVLTSSRGGIGLFSSISGRERHRYLLNCESSHVKSKSYSAGALCLSPDSKVLANCKGAKNGIGVWDQNTSQQVDFFDSLSCFPVGVADKMQWVDDRSCLFLSKIFPVVNNNSRISLVDFRDKKIAWSMSLNDKSNHRMQYVVDAVPSEEGNSIWVVSNFEEIGYADIRTNNGSIQWSFQRDLRLKTSYPKLETYGSQLFCSVDDKVSIYCHGPDSWVRTSILPRSPGGSIRDFSISGGRLFSLHVEGSVIDIWETPPAPHYLNLHSDGVEEATEVVASCSYSL